ncbi:hypothetical protein EFE32_07705 [Lactococcus lactis subsp. lactis]|uniref:hypothetical protein n=1 Tax=Lactococcus lactis TaxID=1358 RepID=UPI00223C4ECB|nr:hypothetical protein [Lactococcus lactis]MCT0016727.1 hypothetical protein [Lactococcus lactis subsp. lactis]
MNKKLKNFIYIIIIIIIFFILAIVCVPWLIGYFVKHTSNHGTFGNNSDWFSFWSNYLGAIVGVISVFAIFYLERYYEKVKEKIKLEEEVYNDFVIKYYYPFSNYLDYLIVPSGHSQKLTLEEFDLRLDRHIREMLNDFKYASPSLKKRLKDWEYYDYYTDLKGDQKQIVQIQIAQELFIQTYTLSKSLDKQYFLKNFWIFFSILILSKTNTDDQNIMFDDWITKYSTVYIDIISNYHTESEQKALCTKAYTIYSKSDKNKSEKLKNLFNKN